jgi:hypothetical protein
MQLKHAHILKPLRFTMYTSKKTGPEGPAFDESIDGRMSRNR